MNATFKQIREDIGISQNAMATRAGVSAAFIYLFENGKVNKLQERTRVAIARAYGVDPVTGEPTAELNSTSPVPSSTEIPATLQPSHG